MKVLIACEFSGIIRNAFAKKGHAAFSCDLVESKSPGHHFQCDITRVLDQEWDLMIAHPPCTHLSSSGARYWKEKRADGSQRLAIDFFLMLYNCKIKKVAVENPVGIISTVWRKPDQIIQPYEFGDPYCKKTCLWLKGLPKLKCTDIIKPVASWSSGSYRGGMLKDGTRRKSELPSLHRCAKKRSISFKGIADAMADQWG